MFNAYIAMSPSLWWNDEYLVGELEQVIVDRAPLDRFLYITTCREGNANIITSTNNFIRLLEAQAPPGLDWAYTHMPNDIHPTTSHRSIYDGLELLFKGWRFDSTVKGADAAMMRAHYRRLSQRYSFDCRPL